MNTKYLILIIALAVVIVAYLVFLKKETKHFEVIPLNIDPKVFPKTECYSGTRTSLLETSSILKGPPYVFLVRYWIFSPTGATAGNVKFIIENGAKIEKDFSLTRKGIYLYSPILLIVSQDECKVSVNEYSIKIPECTKNLGSIPGAIEFGGELNVDSSWSCNQWVNGTIYWKKVFDKDVTVLLVKIVLSKSQKSLRIEIQKDGKGSIIVFTTPSNSISLLLTIFKDSTVTVGGTSFKP